MKSNSNQKWPIKTSDNPQNGITVKIICMTLLAISVEIFN